MPGSEEQATPAQIRQVEPSGGAFSIYCNSIQLGITPWDIRFQVMELIGREGDTATIIKHGSFVMSPTHAKALLEALQSTIRQFEEKFGEIDLARIKAVAGPLTTTEQALAKK